MKTQNIILLTATIRPPSDVKNLQRTDVAIRLNDYIDALAFYLSKLNTGLIDNIVFCDNSNYDLTALRDAAGDLVSQGKVEFIGFNGLDYPSTFGRGYGEFKLVDYAMQYSCVMQAAAEQASIWKITGRYKLANLQTIITTKNPHTDFYCNCKNYPTPWVDMYVLCWNKKSYKELISGIYIDLAETPEFPSAEIKFRKILDEKRLACSIGKRFRVTPVLDGHRGVDNARYASMRAKYLLRVVARRMTPWLWI